MHLPCKDALRPHHAKMLLCAYPDSEDQFNLRIGAVWSGLSPCANRIIGYYRMYEWRAKARMTKRCMTFCVSWVIFARNSKWQTNVHSDGLSECTLVCHLLFRSSQDIHRIEITSRDCPNHVASIADLTQYLGQTQSYTVNGSLYRQFRIAKAD